MENYDGIDWKQRYENLESSIETHIKSAVEQAVMAVSGNTAKVPTEAKPKKKRPPMTQAQKDAMAEGRRRSAKARTSKLEAS